MDKVLTESHTNKYNICWRGNVKILNNSIGNRTFFLDSMIMLLLYQDKKKLMRMMAKKIKSVQTI